MWRLLNARQHFTDWSRDWDELNTACNHGHPLLCAAYVEPLVRHYATPRVVLAVRERPGRPDAMALIEPRRGIWQAFRPAQTQIAPVLAPSAEALMTLLGALPATCLALDLYCLDPDYSPARALAAMPANEHADQAATLAIGLDSDFATYWNSRSRGLRQQVRRALRKAEAEVAPVALDYIDDPEGLVAAFERYADLESRGWKAEGGTAIAVGTRQGEFYGDLISGFGAGGRAGIYELRFGGRLAASQIVLLGPRMLVTLKTTHDEALRPYSPGTLLDYLMIEREYGARRVPAIEYYTNANTEMMRWGTSHRTVSNLRLYRRPWMALATDRLRRWRNRWQRTGAATGTAA